MRALLILIFMVLLLGACNTGRTANEEMPLVGIYSLALDSLMEEDTALNDSMTFIAVDLSNFEDLNDIDKQGILDYFSRKYDVDVMDATFEELREQGYFDEEIMRLDGVLLRMEKVDISTSKVVFTGSKYRSAKGAIGMEVLLRKKGDEWRVTKSKMIWIS
ncbi:peptide ABC transporter substrate-binding protein [Sporosarcina sp. ACRSL]|uniref:peptide ABC transporter substrate-binding protein n=1 Tax=Sporosarcina sp. ACRSL TaxID=2918215 RepID=UPI001EF6F576|nr:peptide ABC transporter substrate-binding protein [Sporosarcina sp. ACRSL]MCG7345954.1 peptide ABC transporter substrate-binding protein [Sporosarcina sp. ACRSL]